MRVLIFGVNGMLGHKLYQRLGSRFDVYGTIRKDFDAVAKFGIFEKDRIIGNIDGFSSESLRRAIDEVKPDFVINAIGVIKQIPTSKDVIHALTLNSILPQRLAEFANEDGFRLITISTDCVFDGVKGNYSEAETPDARDLYGLSKLLGEINSPNALTIRTSIIGRELETGHSIVEWFLGNRGGRVKGYTRAIYTGFPTIVMAGIIADIIAERPELHGVWHVSSDPITKFDLLTMLNKQFDTGVEIEPSDEVVIDRSLNSTNFRELTGFMPISWEGLVDMIATDPTPYGSWKK